MSASSRDDSEHLTLRQRAAWMLGMLAVLAALSCYSLLFRPTQRLGELVSAADDGQAVALSFWIHRVGDDHFSLIDPLDNTEVRVETLDAQDGTQITTADVGRPAGVRGRLYEGSRIQPAAVYVARGRNWKIFVSVIAAAWVLVLCHRGLRFDWRQLAVRER